MKICNQLYATVKPLKRGDKVALVATARAVSEEEMLPAIKMLECWGLEVIVPQGLYDRHGQLAGTDEHRATLMQSLIDDPTLKAIFCCRGGYGTVRIVDRLDFSPLHTYPKWIVGYSDITVFHSHLHATMGIPTLHATMPIDYPATGSTPATESLHSLLFGSKPCYQWQGLANMPKGCGEQFEAEATVVGGNLSILYSLLGSASQIDTHGKVLLIEDLDEYLYHIDRMMQALRRAKILEGLVALVVGGMTKMHDNTIPFGLDARQIVLEATADYGYPVLFDAPFGHLGAQNMTLPLGVDMKIKVSNSEKMCIFAP